MGFIITEGTIRAESRAAEAALRASSALTAQLAPPCRTVPRLARPSLAGPCPALTAMPCLAPPSHARPIHA